MSDRRSNGIGGERSGDRQTSDRPSDGGSKKTPLKESRKFQVLCLACAVYLTPVILMFALAMVKQASKDDFLSLAKWMGASLSPAFMAYIGGVALEDAASKKSAGSE